MTGVRIHYNPRLGVWLVMRGTACVYGPTTPERCAQYIATWGNLIPGVMTGEENQR